MKITSVYQVLVLRSLDAHPGKPFALLGRAYARSQRLAAERALKTLIQCGLVSEKRVFAGCDYALTPDGEDAVRQLAGKEQGA